MNQEETELRERRRELRDILDKTIDWECDHDDFESRNMEVGDMFNEMGIINRKLKEMKE